MKTASRLAAILLLLFASSSFAQFKVGGGCFENNQICDISEYQNMTKLNVYSLISLMGKVDSETFANIPQIQNYFSNTLVSKNWYLTDRAFDPSKCSPVSITGFQNPELVACQNQFEVRIQKSFWATASDQAKGELVTHETTMALEVSGKIVMEAVRAITAELIRPSMDYSELRYQFHSYGLPLFYLATEQREVATFFVSKKSQLCPLKTSVMPSSWTSEYSQRELHKEEATVSDVLGPIYKSLSTDEAMGLSYACKGSDEAFLSFFKGLFDEAWTVHTH